MTRYAKEYWLASDGMHRPGDCLTIGEPHRILNVVREYQDRRALASWDTRSWGPVGDMLLWMGKASWSIRGP
eukprot:8048800-Pyramimonas_sp.AAC.1